MTLLIIAYLGGALTILSPCILPILPFVFARAGQPFVRSTLPMLAGMALTFAVVATLAAVGGAWAIRANEYGRLAAIVLLGLFGLSLISPRIANALSRPAVDLGNNLLNAAGNGRATSSVRSSFVLGIATGLLWAPCAGPILGLVLTGAALKGANLQTTFLLLAYGAGAATSLAIALFAGGKIFARMKQSLGVSERIRQVAGAAVLAGVAAIALGLHTGLLARLSYASTGSFEQALLEKLHPQTSAPETEVASNGAIKVATDAARPFHSDLPIEGPAPSLDGAVTWLNSEPLTTAGLRGKVVLVDFWTYSCINCIRTIPYVRAWAEKYRDQGLVVIGVHSPEFAFEKNIDNVKKAIADFKIGYPVAIDNDYRIWRAFENNYWPAHYLIDAKGQIRYQHFGEGNYRQTEQAIQDLLREAGSDMAQSGPVVPNAKGAEASPDLGHIRSGETYVGYSQATGFVSPEGLKADTAADYSIANPGLNQWGLAGTWTVGSEQASLDKAGGGISYRFSARDLHLVLGPSADGKPVRFQVTVDGKAPGADHGSDTDADGNGTVTATKLYQLVRQSGDVTARNFEIRFLDPGVQAYAFTFG
ncbi:MULTISPECIES: cytochrome c biogenesis protein DipZ [Rhizobium]|uniref:Cytochrome c biogenesis protein CcdA/thiol-disulfide isomerase/thioredoxin n=1 Tax=Rhizobium tropici TaxID=398 RepID=A0A6P1CGT0_RHITR|nr:MULTISPECIES: cytochrome c biogenesis protein DipZ [Rhizobium]AGB75170.1 redoxin domain-containing protein [Rhizobium tropici CIAT 899]MBB4242882.1 cytochrome c biogenesis protein CcdA/thiol-disulfide isomerase/thioredoxin [Rhizobium tropici]MBB5594703.1 cytochrome c biogenesis protein CcdA/thiol-disulfide isomerase/thioredoxin [Rhizobium tropici]MBB6493207.1 cytochrome c biogenesis protein CcdA/thiol-disulfide isomerase/thioredoxin [Rhizobium tropici]NEV14004.1 cytochrome c biogenesis prot